MEMEMEMAMAIRMQCQATVSLALHRLLAHYRPPRRLVIPSARAPIVPSCPWASFLLPASCPRRALPRINLNVGVARRACWAPARTLIPSILTLLFPPIMPMSPLRWPLIRSSLPAWPLMACMGPSRRTNMSFLMPMFKHMPIPMRNPMPTPTPTPTPMPIIITCWPRGPSSSSMPRTIRPCTCVIMPRLSASLLRLLLWNRKVKGKGKVKGSPCSTRPCLIIFMGLPSLWPFSRPMPSCRPASVLLLLILLFHKRIFLSIRSLDCPCHPVISFRPRPCHLRAFSMAVFLQSLAFQPALLSLCSRCPSPRPPLIKPPLSVIIPSACPIRTIMA